ncbi:MAG: undecaprenyl-phosphate glucose phosphotransferase [Hyphomicrobiaceae bacterium]|nr:undecaprenyl-phosphate glucose phosphotransferase [Hyphomicrobiaceae bacterium]
MSTLDAAAADFASAYPIRAPLLIDRSQDARASLVSSRVVRDVTRLTDAAAIALTGLVIAGLYVDEPGAPLTWGYLTATLLSAGVLVVLLDMLRLYRTHQLGKLVVQVPRLVLGWTATFAALLTVIVLVKSGDEFSRGWLLLWFAAGGVALFTGRSVIAAVVSHWNRTGRLNRRAVVYGTGVVTREMLAQLEADLDSDIRICGLFDERGADRAPADTLGYPLLGNLDDLVSFARSSRVDLVLLALPLTAEERISGIVKALRQLPVEVKLPARTTRLRFSPHVYSHIGSLAVIDLLDKPIVAWGAIAKSFFDRVIAAVAIVLLSPVLAAVALAVRLDSRGPVLFRQKRYGFNNELIEVLKFRSMYTDRCDAAAAKLVTKDDPRVTPVGRFIRKTSLDELPQLFNVLKGELSLVGPRPHALSAKAGAKLYDEVVEDYFARHKVKPGITGWAQINGWRGETDTALKIQRRVEHDLYYIENWSVFLDLYILLRTPFALLKTDNAY